MHPSSRSQSGSPAPSSHGGESVQSSPTNGPLQRARRGSVLDTIVSSAQREQRRRTLSLDASLLAAFARDDASSVGSRPGTPKQQLKLSSIVPQPPSGPAPAPITGAAGRRGRRVVAEETEDDDRISRQKLRALEALVDEVEESGQLERMEERLAGWKQLSHWVHSAMALERLQTTRTLVRPSLKTMRQTESFAEFFGNSARRAELLQGGHTASSKKKKRRRRSTIPGSSVQRHREMIEMASHAGLLQTRRDELAQVDTTWKGRFIRWTQGKGEVEDGDSEPRQLRWRLHPEAPARAMWSVVLVLAVLYFTLTVPYRIAFNLADSGVYVALDALCHVVYAVDVFVQCITGTLMVTELGPTIVYRTSHIFKSYLGWRMALDVVSTVPFASLVAMGSGVSRDDQAAQYAMLATLLRLLRVGGSNGGSKRVRPRNNLYTMWTFAMMLVVTLHLVSCAWIVIEGEEAEGQEDRVSRFLTAVYFAVATMASVGYGDVVPTTNSERLFAVVVMLFAVIGFAFLIANVSNVLATWNSSEVSMDNIRQRIDSFALTRALPERLRNRLHAFYESAFTQLQRYPFRDAAVLDELSPGLRVELSLHIHRELVRKGMFRQLSPFVLRDIALAMQPTVYGVGDTVMRTGDTRCSMYFVYRGQVELAVVAVNSEVYYSLIGPGETFNERSLFLGTKAPATARSVTPSYVYSLSRDALDRILMRFPEAASPVCKWIVERYTCGV